MLFFVTADTMRASSGDKRLANRLHVLQLKMLEPNLTTSELGRRVGVNESTVRSILARYKDSDISVGAPVAAKGGGRPQEVSKRWLRCVFACHPRLLPMPDVILT